ncbi:5-formyltetrahydrofolate cyclo-ligase [Planctomycetaceae bacterium]|nr:5-formyltetrahydrofolate cyclo-ligase [Planctomycetaceae bacterium]MDG2391466.1 5-formyltetrahydrofolate cyclo-ligase [Planctomycetaceae bacterium]
MNFQTQKQLLRTEIRQRRVALSDKEARSLKIHGNTISLAELQSAQRVMVYVGYRSEVSTVPLISHLLSAQKTVLVPWCDNDELRLFRLESLDDLQPGAFGIPEPTDELRVIRDRQGTPAELDVVVLPGIAFDRQGGRLGQGKGYYDRLLADVSPKCTLIGLAFDVQLVEEVPTEPHDVRLNILVTESDLYRRSASS